MPDRVWSAVIFGFVTIAIVLFCVILGGYTSFWRSENRIEASTSLMIQACQKRLDTIPQLLEIIKTSKDQTSLPKINQAAKKANHILDLIMSADQPLGKDLIKEFENSQARLTFQLKNTFIQLKTSLNKKDSRQFTNWKKLFFKKQDNLFASRKIYNDEVAYFNTRKKALVISLMAKLFGFNKITYIPISKDVLLPARQIFS